MGAYVGVAIAVLVAAVLLLGWLVPLIAGLVMMRRRQQPAGVVLTVIGAVWGVLGLLILGLSIFAYTQFPKATKLETFDPAHYAGRMGTVNVPYKGEGSLTISERGKARRLKLTTTNGAFRLPAGSYQLLQYEAVGRDRANTKWTASAGLSGRTSTLTVAGDSTQDLDVGPPLKAKVAAQTRSGNMASLDLKLTGRGGDQYMLSKGTGGGGAPRFQVLSPTGQVLWQGQFAYG